MLKSFDRRIRSMIDKIIFEFKRMQTCHDDSTHGLIILLGIWIYFQSVYNLQEKWKFYDLISFFCEFCILNDQKIALSASMKCLLLLSSTSYVDWIYTLDLLSITIFIPSIFGSVSFKLKKCSKPPIVHKPKVLTFLTKI